MTEHLLHHLRMFAVLQHKGCCGVSEGVEGEPGWAAELKQPREVLPHLPRWEYAAFFLDEDEVAVHVHGAEAHFSSCCRALWPSFGRRTSLEAHAASLAALRCVERIASKPVGECA